GHSCARRGWWCRARRHSRKTTCRNPETLGLKRAVGPHRLDWTVRRGDQVSATVPCLELLLWGFEPGPPFIQWPHQVTAAIKHGQDRHRLGCELIDDQIGQRGDGQLACIRQAANPPDLGKAG